MKTSTVTELSPQPSFESAYGTLFPFNIRLNNGDVGQVNTKDQGGGKFAVGTTINYDITKGQFGMKIKLVQPPEGATNEHAPAPSYQAGTTHPKSTYQAPRTSFQAPSDKNNAFALSYSKDLVVAKVIGLDKLEEWYNKILVMLNQPKPVQVDQAMQNFSNEPPPSEEEPPFNEGDWR